MKYLGYEILSDLGKGASGVVQSVNNKSPQTYAWGFLLFWGRPPGRLAKAADWPSDRPALG